MAWQVSVVVQRRWIVFAALGALAALAAAVAAVMVAPGAETPPVAGRLSHFSLADRPEPASDQPFRDPAGGEVRLSDFRGRVLLVNFWATWCAPCVRELPALDRLQATAGGDDFRVLAVSTDRGGESVVRPFLEKLGAASLPVYLDPRGELARALGVTVLPTTLLVDRGGRVVGRLLGEAEWDSADARRLIDFYRERPPDG